LGHFGKVVLLGGMQAVGSAMAVAVHFAGSVAAVVATFERWASASGVAPIASKVEGTAFALALVVGSSVVA
jgi:hypothetical protein